jgi:hypothetical protein
MAADGFPEAARRAFERDGFVRLGKLLPPAALAALSSRLDAIMLGEVRGSAGI